jgi:hypothetical protein
MERTTIMIRRKLLCLAGALAMTCLLGIAAWGQTITSTIVGQVNDPSSGGVPGAQITVTNSETGISTQGTTESSGAYSIPQLQPGTYSLAVTKTGFRTYQVTGIRVLSSQIVRVDVQLKIGAVQQVISVTGTAPLVHTDSPTISGSVTARQIADLPMSMQSIDTLVTIQPGFLYGSSNPLIGGSQYVGGNSFNLDGVSMNDPGNAGAAYSGGLGMVNLPASNALQEFKIDTGANNAEYRAVTGVNMVLKQGTNKFHGEAYGFFENKNLNGNLLLNNAHGLPRPDYDRDQAGGLIGGSIIKDKLFFFGDFFHVRQEVPTLVSLEFPSQAMRQGDFSALCTTFSGGICTTGTQLYNPQTGAPYTNNYINPTGFASQSASLLPYLPLPNLSANPNALPSGATNYQSAVSNNYGIYNVDYRMDWQVSKSDSLNGFYRYSKESPAFVASGSSPASYGNTSNYGYTDHAVSATETHSFGSTAINEFRAAWTDHASARGGENFNIKPWSFIPAIPVQNTGGLPTVTMTGYSGLSDYGTGLPFPAYDIELSDNFTKIRGRHTFKAGILESGYKFNVPGGNGRLTTPLGQTNGGFGTNGSWTGGKGWPTVTASQGNAFADFLLGDISSSNYATVVNSTLLVSREWDWYAQDTWQVNSKLTVTYGFRFMRQGYWREVNNRVSYFDPTNSHLIIPQNSSTLTAPPTAIASLITAYPFETTQQAGLPMSYFTSPGMGNPGPRVGFAYRPFGGSKTVIRGGWGVFANWIPAEVGTLDVTFNPPWRAGPAFTSRLPGHPTTAFLPDLTLSNPFPTTGAASPPSNPLIYQVDRNFRNPRSMQWNFTIEQQLGQNWMTRLSYVGSQTQHDVLINGMDINRPNVQQPNVPLQTQRPWQPWSNIYDNWSGGKANFNQLELELIKRLANGMSFQAEYSWTHSLDDDQITGGLNNPNNINAEYSNSQYVPFHHLVFNYIYELPFGQGQRWLNHKGVVNAALGGWEFSGITTYQTGAPLSVAFSVPSSVVGWQGGRPNIVSGTPLYGGKQSSSHNVVAGVPWFNPAAFAPPAEWTYGNAARNNVFGPGSADWDMSLLKTFTLRESLKLQIRTDWFDAFNHFNLGTPNATIADTRDGGVAQPLAGLITTAGSPSYRIIQLAIRLRF